jgi:pimeloyl-ACP methyl ester carboxylesterase
VPKLAAKYTVIVSDLRGYGDSSKPADGEEQANDSKCAMALDQGRGDGPFQLLEVSGRPPPGGHNLREDVPEMVEEEIRALIAR